MNVCLDIEGYYWILAMIIGGTAIIGNSLVIFITVSRKVPSSATTIFIANLACVDFLTGVMIMVMRVLPSISPPEPERSTLLWIHCKLYCSEFPLWALINVSVFNLVLITFERYFQYFKPYSHKQYFDKRKALIPICLVLIWILGMAASLYTFMSKTVDESKCVNTSNPKAFIYAGGWCLFGMLIIPFTLMTCAYAHIWYNMKSQISQLPSQSQSNIRYKMGQKRLTRVCFIVLATFLICWLPDQIYFFHYALYPNGALGMETLLYHIVVSLGFLNSSMNPLIYASLNPEYKKAFKSLLFCITSNTVGKLSTSRADTEPTSSTDL